MTREKLDDLGRLAYALARNLPRAEAKEVLTGMFATQYDVTPDMAWALFVRGKGLAREKAKERAA